MRYLVWRFGLQFYIIVAFVTFSWSASDPANQPVSEHDFPSSFEAVFAGALWPLYWSWEAAEYVRAAIEGVR